MATHQTSLQNEINSVLNQGPKPVNFIWTAEFKTPQGSLIPIKVLTIDIMRDYISNMGDYLSLEVAFGLGTYQQQIVPYANALTCVLTRTPIYEGTTEVDVSNQIESQLFRCVPKKISSSAVEGSTIYSGDREAGDLTGIGIYHFQLLDLALEQTRMQSTGTVMHNTTADEAIRYMVTKIAKGLNLDANHQIQGVDMVKADNSQVYKHIVIPHGTLGTDVPFYIAHNYGAPYANGFGAYLQKSIWYLYSLFNLKLYDKAKRTLTVVNVPKNMMPTQDRTFRRTFNQLIVLATGDVQHQDPSDYLQQNQGNGIRFASAAKMIESFVTVKDNKATAQRVINATEMLGQSRPNKLNNIATSPIRMTANSFREVSKVSARLGSYITCVWGNSDPGSVFPGMPVRYLYEVDGNVFSLKGQVVRSHSQVQALQPGLFPSGHRTNTALTLFVDHILDWSSAPTS